MSTAVKELENNIIDLSIVLFVLHIANTCLNIIELAAAVSSIEVISNLLIADSSRFKYEYSC